MRVVLWLGDDRAGHEDGQRKDRDKSGGESGGKSFAHCVDTECTRVTLEQLGEDVKLYRNADLMIFDAQYTLMETIEKVNWGHAAATLGLDIAIREAIKRVVFIHHDPASTNEKIFRAEQQARKYHEVQLKQLARMGQHPPLVDWYFGYEGLELTV